MRLSFPFLFALAISKNEWVEDVWNYSAEGRGALESLFL